MRPSYLPAAFALLSLLSILAFSQSFTGAIVGTLTDPSEAGVPNAKVIAIEERSNVRAETVSDAQGAYAFPSLRSGVYRIEVEAAGFQKLVRSGIEVQVNARLRVDLPLTLGAVTENVVITGSAPLVESETGAIGSVIENRKIINLPLNTRNPFQLATLSPGVVPSVNFGDAFNSSANFMINGARGNTSEILIDGITNSVPAANPITVISMFPSPDALEEFKVQTNSYAAEYGRSGGGIVNMVIKSGTNQFRGVLFEFLRNSKMDANNFFANRAARPLGNFKRNQFGFAVGGPILRDKAFFFVNYEGLRQRSVDTVNATVPTDAERRGDFSRSTQVLTGACVPVQIYDPFTTRANPAGGFIRDTFPGSVIPANRQDRVGQNVVKYYPAPNTPGDACTGINNFFSSKSFATDTNQMDMKFDWAPGTANKFMAGLSWRTRNDLAPNHYGNVADTRIINGDQIPSQSMRLDYTRTHSPTLLFNARFGITRLERRNPPNTADNYSLTELGFPKPLDDAMVHPLTFPVFNAAGFAGLGRASAFLDQRGTAYSWSFSATKILGIHSLKAGIEYRVNQSFELVGQSTSGNYSFARGFTQGPDPNRPANDRGNSVASLLLGAGTGEAGILPAVMTSNHYMGLYLQDDIKLSRQLTLNLGLRYDLENGRSERYNQLSYFDFDTASPIAVQTGIPGLRGGLRFVGVDGNPKRQFDTDKNNFAPRVGIAYTMTPRTVLRAGYGMFYLPYVGEAAGWASGINGFLAYTSWTGSIDGLTPTDPLANPFPRGLSKPTAPGSGLLTNLGQDFGASGRDGAVDRGARVSYSQQWNFNLQRELPGALSVEVAYTGSRGVKLPDGPLGHQLNQLPVETLALGTALQQQVANPFAPYVSTGPLSRPTTTRGQLLRPYPQFLGLYNFRPASAASTYHAFQARVGKRFSSGLTLLMSYTNAKLIDDSSEIVGFLGPAPAHQDVYNRRLSRSLSGQDVSQRFVMSYVYDLPIGRGKKLGASMPRALDLIAGNWQVNGILTFSTSVPLPITTAQDNSQSFTAGQRPNISGNAAFSGERSTDEKLAKWFDTSVFSQPAPFTFGNAPRTLPNVRRDGIKNWDFSLFKQFPINETKYFQFRAEFFNFTNSVQFAGPGTAFGNPGFGVVSAQANAPRQIQLGLKFYF